MVLRLLHRVAPHALESKLNKGPVPSCYYHPSGVIRLQVDGLKYRWEHNQDALRTHLRSDDANHIHRWSGPHVATFF